MRWVRNGAAPGLNLPLVQRQAWQLSQVRNIKARRISRSDTTLNPEGVFYLDDDEHLRAPVLGGSSRRAGMRRPRDVPDDYDDNSRNASRRSPPSVGIRYSRAEQLEDEHDDADGSRRRGINSRMMRAQTRDTQRPRLRRQFDPPEEADEEVVEERGAGLPSPRSLPGPALDLRQPAFELLGVPRIGSQWGDRRTGQGRVDEQQSGGRQPLAQATAVPQSRGAGRSVPVAAAEAIGTAVAAGWVGASDIRADHEAPPRAAAVTDDPAERPSRAAPPGAAGVRDGRAERHGAADFRAGRGAGPRAAAVRADSEAQPVEAGTPREWNPKAITALLKNCMTVQDLEGVVAARQGQFNAINTVAAMTKLAKLAPSQPQKGGGPQGVERLLAQLELLIAQHANHAQYAMPEDPVLLPQGVERLLAQLELLIAQHAASYSSREVCNIIWALGRMKRRLSTTGMQALFSRLTSPGVLSEATPQHLAMLAWALAILNNRDSGLWDLLLASAVKQMGQFGPQELSNLAWGMGGLDIHDRRVLGALADQAMVRAEEFSTQAVANVVWGMAQLGYVHEPMMKALMAVATAKADSFHPFETSGLLDACLRLGWPLEGPEADSLLQALAAPALRDPRGYPVSALCPMAAVLAGVSSGGHAASAKRLLRSALARLDEFETLDMVRALMAMTRLRQHTSVVWESPSETQVIQMLINSTIARLHNFPLHQLASVVSSLALLDHLAKPLADAVASRVKPSIVNLPMHVLLSMCQAFARAGHGSEELARSAEVAILARSNITSGPVLASCCVALAAMGHPSLQLTTTAAAALRESEPLEAGPAAAFAWAAAAAGIPDARERCASTAVLCEPHSNELCPDELCLLACALLKVGEPAEPWVQRVAGVAGPGVGGGDEVRPGKLRCAAAVGERRARQLLAEQLAAVAPGDK